MALPDSFEIPGDPLLRIRWQAVREVRSICAANPNASIAWQQWDTEGALEVMVTDPSGAYWFVVASPDGTTVVL
jgi:hypothetical protein